MSQQDIVYCDAAFFCDSTKDAIIGIVYGKEATRIRVRAKNSTMAELLGIVLARKLYPGKLIVNDCAVITSMFRKNRIKQLRRFVGDDERATFLMESINLYGVLWMPRRSDEESKIADSLTRSKLTNGFKRFLSVNSFILKEFYL
jgi:hypothetical protein